MDFLGAAGLWEPKGQKQPVVLQTSAHVQHRHFAVFKRLLGFWQEVEIRLQGWLSMACHIIVDFEEFLVVGD